MVTRQTPLGHDSEPSRAQYHHGDLRAHLIETVRELVELHGPEGFSVAEAARRAGVSSAAPYKHFKDRPEILRGVAAAAMERLRLAMEQGAAAHPVGSLEAVAAVGLAYVTFAKSEPGVFRLVFGLNEGHEEDSELAGHGDACFGSVVRVTAERLKLDPAHHDVRRCAYLLWSFVHGHSFLTIDGKITAKCHVEDDWAYLMDVAGAVLGRG